MGLFGKKLSKKVLIVEDDALLAKVLSQAFAKEGFKVSIVGNGLEVVEKVKSFIPDIIMLDLLLPGLDGFAVMRELQGDAKLKKIPVVILSNLDDAGDVKSTRVLGAETYFIKANTSMQTIVDYVKNKLKV